MIRRVLLPLVVLVVTVIYLLGLTYALGFAAALRTPRWWRAAFHTPHSAGLSWLLFSHAAALILVSLPFAGLLAWLYGRLSVRVALLVAIASWVVLGAPLVVDSWNISGGGMWIAETLELLVVLPASVNLFRMLPSNLRWGV